MKVGVVVTNYNNSAFTVKLLASIRAQINRSPFAVVIVDNNSSDEDLDVLEVELSKHNDFVLIKNSHNVGYFAGLNIGVRYLEKASVLDALDVLVVGNNDLEFPDDFYEKILRSACLFEKYEVICPDIITLDGVHQNPHIRHSVSAFRELVWDIYYSNFFLSRVILFFARTFKRIVERNDYKSYRVPGEIFQGYGACYLLSNRFFARGMELWSPTFLMGEEYFLFSEVKIKGGKQFYTPDITVRHVDHATCSNVPSRRMWTYSKTAHFFYRLMRSCDDELR